MSLGGHGLLEAPIPWEVGTGKASPGRSFLPFLVAFLLPLSPGEAKSARWKEPPTGLEFCVSERESALICPSLVCSWGVRNISTGGD